MVSSENKKAIEKMENRKKDEQKLKSISVLELSGQDYELTLSLLRNENNELKYRLELEFFKGLRLLVDYNEEITLDDLVETYISLGDFLNNRLEQDLWVGWGRMALVLMKGDYLEKIFNVVVGLYEEDPQGEHDIYENHIQLAFDLDDLREFKAFLKRAYESICDIYDTE